MSEQGHRYAFGAPAGGWPTFGPDGKIVQERSVTGDSVDDEATPTEGAQSGDTDGHVHPQP